MYGTYPTECDRRMMTHIVFCAHMHTAMHTMLMLESHCLRLLCILLSTVLFCALAITIESDETSLIVQADDIVVRNASDTMQLLATITTMQQAFARMNQTIVDQQQTIVLQQQQIASMNQSCTINDHDEH